jgi:hypothetical protein
MARRAAGFLSRRCMYHARFMKFHPRPVAPAACWPARVRLQLLAARGGQIVESRIAWKRASVLSVDRGATSSTRGWTTIQTRRDEEEEAAEESWWLRAGRRRCHIRRVAASR